MIGDSKHLIGKFEFKITQKGNVMSNSGNAPFGTSLRVAGSTSMYGGNANVYLSGRSDVFQYAESTISSNRSPIPPPRSGVYHVEAYDEFPLRGLQDIDINAHSSATQFVDLRGIEEFLKSNRAKALRLFTCVMNPMILPVPTERLINMILENGISCLRFRITGTPASGRLGAVGSIVRVAEIPLVEYIDVSSLCCTFPDLSAAKHTLKRVVIGSPNVSSSFNDYLMKGVLGDLTDLYRLEDFRLERFAGTEDGFNLPISTKTITIWPHAGDINLPENVSDLINLESIDMRDGDGSAPILDVPDLSLLNKLKIFRLHRYKYYISDSAKLPLDLEQLDIYLPTKTQTGQIPDLSMFSKLNYVRLKGYKRTYTTANRPISTPDFIFRQNDSTVIELDAILGDFYNDIVSGKKIAGTKRLNISNAVNNTIYQVYPTNDLAELTILNGGSGYIIGDILKTRTNGSGCIIQRTTGPLGDLTGYRPLNAPIVIANAGTGYAVGSTFRVKKETGSGRGGWGGIVKVTSVNGTGGVTGLSIVAAGSTYLHDEDYLLLSGVQAEYEVTSVDGSGKILAGTFINRGADFHEDQTVWTGGAGTGASLRGRTTARRIVQYGYTVIY